MGILEALRGRLPWGEKRHLAAERWLHSAGALRAQYESLYDGVHFIRLEQLPPLREQMEALCTHPGFRPTPEVREQAAQLLALTRQMEQQARSANTRLADRLAPAIAGRICPVEGRMLDAQQLRCIAKESRNHLVIAGAGTGKTTTIIGYVKYLLDTARAAPRDILVLSFTRDSAGEMRQRLRAETGQSIEASTFHSLGMDILAKAEGIRPRVTRLDLPKFIREEMTGTLMKDPRYLARLNQYVIHSRVVARDTFSFRTMREYQHYLRENAPVTLKGEIVKSYGEMEIANYLFLHDIPYVYEGPYEADTRTEEFGEYRPDFYLPDYGIYIEYFAIDRQGRVPDWFSARPGKTATETYREGIAWKRQTHREHGTRLIECFAWEQMEGRLLTSLRGHLLGAGVRDARMSPDRVWEVLNAQNNNSPLDGLCDLFQTVISLLKSKNMTVDQLRARNHLNDPKQQEQNRLLLELLEPVYRAYCTRLEQAGEIDFSDMINRASDTVRRGGYQHGWTHVIIDEYQDISAARFGLVKALRDSREFTLFCVGDDWQSIYRFAGSDVGFFVNFEKFWGISEISRIETTYRFPQRLVELSSRFIMENPLQIRKSIRSLAPSAEMPAVLLEGSGDGELVQLLARALDTLPREAEVFLLGRYSFDAGMLKRCRSQGGEPEFRVTVTARECRVTYIRRKDLHITFLTVHRSKGLQADYVFLLNNKGGRLGFPSQVPEASLPGLLLEDGDPYPFAEERRLYYVALTRARKKVFLLAPAYEKSAFVRELFSLPPEEPGPRGRCPLCGGRLVRREGKYGVFYGCANYSVSGCRYSERPGEGT